MRPGPAAFSDVSSGRVEALDADDGPQCAPDGPVGEGPSQEVVMERVAQGGHDHSLVE
jgi:hypothetical protein